MGYKQWTTKNWHIGLMLLVMGGFQNVVQSKELPEMEITSIAENVYLHKSYQETEGWGLVSSNGLVVVDGRQAFIIDTPWSNSDTAKLAEWIKNNNWQLVSSISTHWHSDRTAGIDWLNNHSVPTIASSMTNTLLKENQRPLAKIEFQENNFTVKENTIEAFYPGPGHAMDNLVVWLPKAKLLFGGCFIRSLRSKTMGNVADGDTIAWPKSVKKVMNRYPEPNIVIPGHGAPGDHSLLQHTLALLKDHNKNK